MIYIISNVVALILILAIFAVIYFFDNKSRKKALEMKNIVMSGFLVALVVILDEFVQIRIAGVFQLRLGDLFLILAGFISYGLLGIGVGIASDLIGALINISIGGFSLVYTAINCLWVIGPLYIVKLLQLWNWKYIRDWMRITFAITIISAFVIGINPIILRYLFGIASGWKIFYIPRLIEFPVTIVVYSLVVNSSLIFLNKAIKLQWNT